MTIEADNAKEEIKEIVEKCVKCGLCKNKDSVFMATREEQFSPRGKAILLSNGYYDKFIYIDTLSKACEESCPLGIKIHEAITKARKVLVEEKRDIKEARQIIVNLETSGNIFGEKNE